MNESQMRTILLGQPGLAALVGERMYPQTLPQGATLPAVTYSLISGTTEGDSQDGPGVSRRRYQFDCWGATYSDATAVATALTTAVSGTRRIGQASFVDNEVDGFEAETQRWRRIVDVMVWR